MRMPTRRARPRAKNDQTRRCISLCRRRVSAPAQPQLHRHRTHPERARPRPGRRPTRLLAQLGVPAAAVEHRLRCWLEDTSPVAKIDPQALATLGIDLDSVRERLEQTFGPGALERTRSACLGICLRLKLALAHTLDHASDPPLGDEHVLLGMLTVSDSVAARLLAEFGVTLETAQAAVAVHS
jgi:ATP-dependent Clp protease ATP-binding subunit ClpA